MPDLSGVSRPTAEDRVTILALAVLLAMLDLLAAIYRLDDLAPHGWGQFFLRGGAVLMLGVLGTVAALTLRATSWRERPFVPASLTAWLCLGQLGLTFYLALPNRIGLPAIAAAWLGGAVLGRFAGAAAAIAWAMLGGFALYIGFILAVPFAAQRADMLAFIGHAIDVYRAGGNPYTADYTSIDANAFLYPPAQWLIYLPARVLGLDLRVVNLVCAAAIVALVEWRCRSGETALRAGVYPVMLNPITLSIMYAGQVWPYWLAMLVFALLVLNRHWIGAAVVVALAIGLRQTGLVPATVVIVALAGRVTLRRWLAAAAAGAATLLASVLPFVGSVAGLRQLLIDGPQKAIEGARIGGNPGNQVALANLLDSLGLRVLDRPVQAGLVLLAVGLAWFAGRRGARPVLIIAGLGYAAAITVNAYVQQYYYVAGFLIAAIGLTADCKNMTLRPVGEHSG